MQCICTRTERNVTNVLFLAERSRIDDYPWIAGTIIAEPAIPLDAWWCVRYLVGSSYRGGGRSKSQEQTVEARK